MSKIGHSPAQIRNYLLEKYIEDENARYEDGSEFTWHYDNRMNIVEPLLRDSAEFGAEILRLPKNPSSLDEGEVVIECIRGSYDTVRARHWIFSHLYKHAVDQANATYILFSTSHVSQGFQLWRSLYETYVICEFINIHRSTEILLQDYIGHTLLRSWIRTKESINALCRNNGKALKYHESQIAELKTLYASKNWKPNEEYGWAKPVFGGKKCSFRDILNCIGDELTIFYRISSMEVHPTLGQRFVLPGLGYLPLPAVPMSACGVVDTEDMGLDLLTAKVLHRMTCRADAFLRLDKEMRERLGTLKRNAESVFLKRKRATSPDMPESRGVVVRQPRWP